VPVFVLVLIVAVGVVAVAAAVFWARRSHDDEHSVEGYHRQLHTLEVLRTHQPGSPAEGDGEAAAYPESALRVTPRPTVRLTEPGKAIVPPVPPPPVANPDKPVTFDDAGPVVSTPAPSSGKGWQDDKALHGIDHRPRRLAAPAAAVAAVTVLIVVLIVAGVHNSPPPHHHTSSTTTTHASAKAKAKVTTKARTTTGSHRHGRQDTTTTTTLADTAFVSLPKATSDYAANYTVKSSSYALAMSATSAACWVDATEKATGAVLFTGVINPGQTRTVTGSGEVSLVVGAPDYFTATLNGTAVSFPFGFLSPFTMDFKPTPHAGLSS
jgi:hypothetical protein